MTSEATPDMRKCVLVVDDTPANIAFVIGALKGLYRTKAATSGRAALELVRSAERPDIVLLDVMMPDMDGYAVCLELRSAPAPADIPVIFLTAKVEGEDEARGFELGAADYIHKPMN